MHFHRKIPNLISLYVYFRVHMTKHYDPPEFLMSFTFEPQLINVGDAHCFLVTSGKRLHLHRRYEVHLWI